MFRLHDKSIRIHSQAIPHPLVGQLSLTCHNLDADGPEVRAVEGSLVGAGEAHDGRPVDVVLKQEILWALVRHVGPRGNRGRDPWRNDINCLLYIL